MKNFLKFIAVALIATLTLSVVYGYFNSVVMGNYFTSSFSMGILLTLLVVAFVVVAYKGSRAIIALSLVALLTVSTGCSRAKSNQQVLVSEDCGMNWKKINAGDAVPRGGVNPCYMKVVIPNFPMQGDMKFLANLAQKVKVTAHIDYDYSIVNGLAFINEAKYIGKANANADSAEALDPAAFEGAENRVIDKRIKEVAKRLFLDEDIVELEQDELELKLENEVNKILEKLGVKLNFVTLTFLPDEQTRQAIDISTAMRIYKSNNLEQLGNQVMVARAGATQITVENHTETKQVEE